MTRSFSICTRKAWMRTSTESALCLTLVAPAQVLAVSIGRRAHACLCVWLCVCDCVCASYEVSIELCTKLVQMNPKFSAPFKQLATVYRALREKAVEDPALQEKYLTKEYAAWLGATQADPTDADAKRSAAVLVQHATPRMTPDERFEQEFLLWREAYHLDQDHAETAQKYGAMLVEKEKFTRARGLVRMCVCVCVCVAVCGCVCVCVAACVCVC